MGLLSYIYHIVTSSRLRRLSTGSRQLAVDRRGVTALMFAVSITFVLGIVGLATEAGTWYLARTQAYNAAYAAAVAGALAASNGADTTAVQDVAQANASNNGFSAGVVVNIPPASGNFTGTATATEVLVTVNFDPLFAALFSRAAITVSARAVGALQPVGSTAVLSLTGELNIVQNQLSTGQPGSYYASNNTGPTAVTVAEGTGFNGFTITTPGDCQTCPVIGNSQGYSVLSGGYGTDGVSILYRPNESYQPPTSVANGFPAIDALPLPATVICPTGLVYTDAGTDPSTSATYAPYGTSISGMKYLDSNYCPTTPNPQTNVSGTLVPATGDGSTCTPTAIPCGYYNMNVVVSSGTTLTVAPHVVSNQHVLDNPGDATYLLINASLDVQNGATVQCQIFDGNGWQYVCAPGTVNSAQNGQVSPFFGFYGVTFVLAGSSVGTLTFESGSIANIAAPGASTYSYGGATPGVLNGVLFYRRGQATGESSTAPGVNISDPSGNLLLNGVQYYPQSYVVYSGNTNQTYLPFCASLIGGYVTLGFLNPSDAALNASNGLPTQFQGGGPCTAYNAPIPGVQGMRVVE